MAIYEETVKNIGEQVKDVGQDMIDAVVTWKRGSGVLECAKESLEGILREINRLLPARPESAASGTHATTDDDDAVPSVASVVHGKHTKEVIGHLSSDITTLATNLMTFRSRIAFTVIIGPFILLGSFLVATRGQVDSGDVIAALDGWAPWVAGVVCLAYFGMCQYGVMVDVNIGDKCNEWRRQLLSLAEGDDGRKPDGDRQGGDGVKRGTRRSCPKKCWRWLVRFVTRDDGREAEGNFEIRHPQRVVRAYWSGFGLVFVAFMGVGYVMTKVLSGAAPPSLESQVGSPPLIVCVEQCVRDATVLPASQEPSSDSRG